MDSLAAFPLLRILSFSTHWTSLIEIKSIIIFDKEGFCLCNFAVKWRRATQLVCGSVATRNVFESQPFWCIKYFVVKEHSWALSFSLGDVRRSFWSVFPIWYLFHLSLCLFTYLLISCVFKKSRFFSFKFFFLVWIILSVKKQTRTFTRSISH